MQQEFVGQRMFIASEFKEVEKKIERRFEEMETKIETKFEKMDKRVEKIENDIRDLKIHQENALAITRNSRLTQFHQPIHPIKVLKLNPRSNMFIWISHPEVPKHMKSVYYLGQRAKGLLGPDWKETLKQQGMFFLILFLHNEFY